MKLETAVVRHIVVLAMHTCLLLLSVDVIRRNRRHNAATGLFFRAEQRRFRFHVCAVFRNEGPYLEEWLTYHLAMGIDHIHLFDNNLGDEEINFTKRLNHMAKVTFVNRRGHSYAHTSWFSEYYRTLTVQDWCLFIDIDEFFTFAHENMTLEKYAAMANSTCEQVKLNWMVYGNNGQKNHTKGTVVERFPKPVADPYFRKLGRMENTISKAFIRGGLTGSFVSTHFFRGDNVRGCNSNLKECRNDVTVVSPPVWNICYLRHYFTKSEQEWRERKMRKWEGPIGPAYGWQNYNMINSLPPNTPAVV